MLLLFFLFVSMFVFSLINEDGDLKQQEESNLS